MKTQEVKLTPETATPAEMGRFYAKHGDGSNLDLIKGISNHCPYIPGSREWSEFVSAWYSQMSQGEGQITFIETPYQLASKIEIRLAGPGLGKPAKPARITRGFVLKNDLPFDIEVGSMVRFEFKGLTTLIDATGCEYPIIQILKKL